jgi:hypothetical protein
MTRTGRTAKGGFTLIEIVVSWCSWASWPRTVFNFAGQAVRGFFISRDAMEITQKAQIAFNRMRAEFTYLTAVSASSAASITYTAEFSSGSEENTSPTTRQPGRSLSTASPDRRRGHSGRAGL